MNIHLIFEEFVSEIMDGKSPTYFGNQTTGIHNEFRVELHVERCGDLVLAPFQSDEFVKLVKLIQTYSTAVLGVQRLENQIFVQLA